jgi:hypothetical protein
MIVLKCGIAIFVMEPQFMEPRKIRRFHFALVVWGGGTLMSILYTGTEVRSTGVKTA